MKRPGKKAPNTSTCCMQTFNTNSCCKVISELIVKNMKTYTSTRSGHSENLVLNLLRLLSHILHDVVQSADLLKKKLILKLKTNSKYFITDKFSVSIICLWGLSRALCPGIRKSQDVCNVRKWMSPLSCKVMKISFCAVVKRASIPCCAWS